MSIHYTKRNGIGIRFTAICIDIVLAILLCILLTRSTGKFFTNRAIIMLKIGSPDSFWRGPIPMIISIAGYFFFGLPFAGAIVFFSEAFLGISLGKLVLKIKICGRDGQKAPLNALIFRYALKTIGAWGLTISLLFASIHLAFLFTGLGIIIFFGCFMVLDPTKLAVHDCLAKTAVYSVHREG